MQQLHEALIEKVNQKTKPIGSLGKLEELAIQIGLVQQTLSPTIINPTIVVFAGDHGIASTGLVNPFPQEVTAQMVYNFVNGGAAINVFAKLHAVDLSIVNAGVAAEFPGDLPIIHASIAKGTKNYLTDFAMSETQANQAIETGKSIVQDIYKSGCNTIGFGEMGIGNSSSAALIMSNLLQIPLEKCVGAGTGANIEQKLNTLKQVSNFHELEINKYTPVDLLQRVGGFEIAMMMGAFLEAYSNDMLILVDGFIATAAFLLAHKTNSQIVSNAVFAHCSHEMGHTTMLNYLHVKPILQLDMRLGEGTGAALAIPIIKSACAMINEMASFETAGISS